MKRILFSLLLFALHLDGLYCQDIMTVEDAISIGLQNNYDIEIAGYEKDIAENNYRKGNAGFLPTLDWSGGRSYNNQNVEQEFLGGTSNSVNGAKTNSWNSSVDFNWVIFDGLRMFKTYYKLDELRMIGTLEEKAAFEDIFRDMVIAYYSVVLEKNRVAALDSSLNLSRERVAISKSQYEMGRSAKSDYLSAQVDFNTDSSALIKQKEILKRSKNNMNNLLARDIEIDFDVPVDIPLDSSILREPLIEEALVNNTVLNIIKKNLNVVSLEVKEISAEKIPKLGVNAGYTYNNFSSQAGFLLSNRANGFNYGLSATWNIFNGTNINRRIQNAQIGVKANETLIEKNKLELKRDINNIYLEYSNNLALVRLEKASLVIALENTRIAVDRYRLGKSSFLELREAQVNAVRAYGRLIDAIYLTKVAEVELMQLSGRIMSVSGNLN